MTFPWLRHLVLGWVVFTLTVGAAAQAPTLPPLQRREALAEHAAKPPAEPADPAKEAYILESSRLTMRKENDGTGRRTYEARFRAQSAAGVQQLGLLVFGYHSAMERLQLDIRVRKPDGTVVATPTESIQDMPAEVQRVAPQYTDYRQKHVAVPALNVGDVLEYTATYEEHTPLIPGHFWMESSFERSVVTLREEFVFDIPAGREIKVKAAPRLKAEEREENGRRIMVWSGNNPTPVKPEDLGEDDKAVPDIQVSSFRSWDEVAAWYGTLARPQAAVDESIRAKATELTRGLTSERDKLRAIHRYVTPNIRYISISLGLGRYQPHTAAEVLRNQFGDCKDKHTLLAALLSAVGIRAEPVLVSVGRKLDAEVPSPSPFDHLISAVMLSDGVMYVDSTMEVAPLGYLVPDLRGKQALQVEATGGKMVELPAEPVVPNRQLLTIEAKLSAEGELSAVYELEARGDSEIPLRLGLRGAPERQWPELAKGLLALTGLEADVSDVSTEFTDLEKPARIKFRFVSKNKTNLSDPAAKLDLPIPGMFFRPAATPEQRKDPIQMHGEYELTHRLRLEAPTGTQISGPVPFERKEDFGEYRASYKAEGNVFTAERTLHITARELPRARYRDYNRLHQSIASDEEQKLALRTVRTTAKATTAAKAGAADANTLYQQAMNEWQQDMMGALRKLERVVELEPSHVQAWRALGNAYASFWRSAEEGDKAVRAYRKSLEAEPDDRETLARLMLALFRLGRYAEVADFLRQQIDLMPTNTALYGRLGDMLLRAGKPTEAIEPLRTALGAAPNSVELRLQLAEAYAKAGRAEDSRPLIDAVLDESAALGTRERASLVLAEQKIDLDRAEQGIQGVLREVYGKLGTVDVRLADEPDLRRAWRLAELWTTAGKIYLQRGELDRAERYLRAGWMWSQQLGAGNPLAQVLMKQGKTAEAMRTWAQAFSGASLEYPELKGEFHAAAGGETQAKRLVEKHRLDMQDMRSIEVPNRQKLAGYAELYVVIGPGSVIEAADVKEGDEQMGAALAKTVTGVKLPLPFPDDGEIRVLRTLITSCSKLRPTCTAVLNPAPAFQRWEKEPF